MKNSIARKRIKKSARISVYLLLTGLALLLLGGFSPKDQPIRHRLIYNSDGSSVLGKKFPLSVDDINAYVDASANTQVTTFMMCSGSDFMYYRSKYGRVLGDDRNGTLDCGSDTATYKWCVNIYRNHLNLEKEGTDLIDASLRRAKEKGMEAFITYRMNDIHFNDTTLHCPVAYTDFWVAHPEYWLNEDIVGWWHSAGALDFSKKEVRDHKLNIITEQLEKYKMIDGYDLDFMRFIVYFKISEGEKNAPLMTNLVKAIKTKIDEISAKRGKKILLSARVPADLDFCLKKGLDVKDWIRLGLLDFISIGVHFVGNPAIPIAKFKRELAEPTIPVYASIDDIGYYPYEVHSHGMYRGMASHILAQGGDGIYLFDYNFGDYTSNNGKLLLGEGGYVCREGTPDLLHQMGSLKTLRKRNKIYCLDDGSSVAYGYKPETPLPLPVSPGNFTPAATIFVGDDPKKDVPEEAVLFLRTDKPAQFYLFVNGVKVETQKPEYIRLFDRATNLKKNEKVYAYILPASCLKHGDNEVRLYSFNSELFNIKRLEIALKYGDVKTYGYF